MATVTFKNIPDDLYEQLKQAATHTTFVEFTTVIQREECPNRYSATNSL